MVTEPKGGLRERRKKEKLEKIERAARALFASKGFAATTTRDIARKAGIAAGTLFLYFPDKRELLLHVFRAQVKPVSAAAFAGVPDGTAFVPSVLHVWRHMAHHYLANPELSRVYFRELLFLDGTTRASSATFAIDFVYQLAALVETAKVRGEVAVSVETLHAGLHLFYVYSMSMLSLLGGMVPTIEPQAILLERLLEQLLRGLAPATPPTKTKTTHHREGRR